MADKSGKEIRDNLKEANKFARNLKEEFLALDGISDVTKGKMAKMTDSLRMQVDIGDKLNALIKQRNSFIEEEVKNGRDISDKALEAIDTEIKFLEKKKQQKELQEEFNNSLLSTIGFGSKYVKYFKKGGAAALGWIAATKAVEVISDGLKNTVGLGKELYTNFGLSAGAATEIALQTAAASFSIEGLIYGTEALAEAAKSSVEYFGTISNLTMDSQKNIATLNKLGVDATKSVQLDKIFKDAAGDGSDLTDNIKVIAKKEGVTAKKLFEGMADDMSRLVGATEDEIMAMAKTNAQLIKRGFTMKQLEDISNNVLSVEQSMRAEAKARAFIGRDINANGVRQAALALQTARTQDERNAAMLDMSRILEEQVGSAKDFNDMSIMQRKLFAEAYGISVDGITEMLTKQEKFNELQAKGMSDEEALAEIKYQEELDASISLLKEMGSEAGNLSMAMLPALASFKQLGGENTMIWKGFSKATKGAGNLLKKLYEMTAGKLLGKLGGIGETLGGGMVKSKSGKLFSKDSPQGKMITNLSGKGPKTPKIPKTPKMPKGGGKSMSGITGAIEKIDAKKLLAGGAALVLVAASVFIFAKAVQEFTEVGWKEVGMAIVSMVALVGALALVGTIMSSGVGAVAILAGAAAMIVIAGSMYVLGKAIQEIATGFSMLGELGTQLTELVSIAPDMLLLAYSFGVLGASMIPLAAGLALITPFIGTLAVLGTMLPLINNSLNGGSNSNDTASETKTDTMGELLSEIKGLRQDLQAQPIMVSVDGKVVSRISRVQNRQSVSKNGYGG